MTEVGSVIPDQVRDDRSCSEIPDRVGDDILAVEDNILAVEDNNLNGIFLPAVSFSELPTLSFPISHLVIPSLTGNPVTMQTLLYSTTGS